MKYSYLNGYEPQLGDIIKVVDTKGLDYYSPIKKTDAKYVVLEVSTSGTIKIGHVGSTTSLSTYRANRFELVTRAGKVVDKVADTVIVDDNYRIVHRSSGQDVVKVLQGLLLKNPTSVYHVFTYVNSAKTKTPEISFFNPVEPVVEASPIVKTSEVVTQQLSNNFRKLSK